MLLYAFVIILTCGWYVYASFTCIQRFIIFQSALRPFARAESSRSPRFSTRRMSTCVTIARVSWVSGQRSLSLQLVKSAAEMAPPESVYRSGYFRNIAPRTRGHGCVQSAVAARACEFCSYKVHSLTPKVSWNTSM